MKTVLSVDVGLKNLGVCIMTKAPQLQILYWNTINVFDTDLAQAMCQGQFKNGKQCTRKATNKTQSSQVFCKTHTPPKTKMTVIKTRKLKTVPLQEIARRIQIAFDTLVKNNTQVLSQVEKVYIELQPKVNNKMKFSSHILFSKFVELYASLNLKTQVVFESARRKLQVYKGPPIECTLKTPYSRRKYLGIEHTKRLLKNIEDCTILLTDFNKNKKKDDLADCFLMCYGKLS